MKKIESIEKGWGFGGICFSTLKHSSPECELVDEIKQEGKQIGIDNYITVYRGYKNDKIVFEMGASSDVTVFYEQEKGEKESWFNKMRKRNRDK